MSIIKNPYEISVWKDVLMYVGTPREGKTSPTSNINDLTAVEYQFYTEERLAIIGSDTMTSPMRAVNPILKKNINGVETFTFDMYYQYEDVETGEIVHNPLIDFVIDERKIKLKYEDKWYDFIVKKDDEKGREYKYSYTCNGLAANELGKTGFSIELDTELENNMGTVQELAREVLKDCDWQLAESGQDVIQQTNEEALYSLLLTSSITTAKTLSDSSFRTIPSGARIYAYYTPYATQETNYFQFIYVDQNDGFAVPDLKEDGITIDCNDTRTYDLYVSNVTWTNDKPNFATGTPSVAQYRGLRYVRKQLMTYDPVLDQTVLKYTRNNEEYYGYTTTEYIDSTTIENYIYNSTNFAGTSYWGIYNSDSSVNKSIIAKVYPDVKATSRNSDFVAYLAVKFGNSIATKLVNEGIIQNYSRINRFDKGDKYRLKISIGYISSNAYTVPNSIPVNCIVKKYERIDSDENQTIYFNSSGATATKTGEYFIVDMVCAQSATWRELKENVGIFFQLKIASNREYYIKDVQFYRYIEDNGIVLEPGQVPTVRIDTLYHFYKPSENIGKMSEEDYVFSDSDPALYTPLFGSGDHTFEKVRSITEKESNRFNLLQLLSETFECWVRFDIAHELDGQISIEDFTYYNPVNLTQGPISGYYIYDWITKSYIPATGDFNDKQIYYSAVSRKRQVKRVTFYKERLVDNYAGFKYGINLKDNNRTLDSEQIVTKIIVKDNTCDQAENGFCSIARAKDNPIKENFVYNFDYYTSQGIINASDLNNDLYLEIVGSIGIYPRLARLNKKRNSLIDSAAPLANSIDDLSSKYQVATLMYNEAAKELQRMIDPQSGTIYQYTHYVYDDFYNQYGRKGTAVNTKVPSYKNEIYFIQADGLTNITANSGTLSYYKVTTDIAPVSGKTYYYISSSVFTQLNSTKFRDGCVYYEKLSGARYTANTYMQTGATTTTLTFTGSGSPEIYIYGAARRTMAIGAEDFINDNFTISTLEKIVTQQANQATAQADMEKYGADLEATKEQYDSIQDQLKDIARATDEVEKEFNIKYSRYIQEGSWTDDNYMDDDLYYLDSLGVLYQSAYPKVSYNFSVLDLSQLEGYELYKFDIGNKTYVEDTEFFGYQIIGGLKTPVREQVVVTEANLHLDEPDKNDLKVQNYKSHFEDLFQRITAATQSLEYHSGEYGRAAGVVTSTGELSETVLQKSFATSAYIIQNSHDQSVVWDDTGISATNLSDPAQITRLASSGILVSSDGGRTWGVAISGYGINTAYLTAGQIDADKINIMSGAYPTFKWDALGLRAYGFTTDESGNILTYDPSRIVIHDKYGLYGVNGLTDVDFKSLQEVKDNALFGLTWDGLFIKSLHRDGYVSISSDDDITLREVINVGQQKTERIRGKFGLITPAIKTYPSQLEFEANETAYYKLIDDEYVQCQDGEVYNSETQYYFAEDLYGLVLYNQNGEETVTTKSDGTLWLKDSMTIGKERQSNTIYIGVGEDEIIDQQPTGRYKVINVNDTSNQEKFVVYSDGTLKASGVNIEGYINATSGKIGNMTISGIEDTVGVRISPSNAEFKYDGSLATPSSVEFTVTHGLGNDVNYYWYLWKDPSQIDSHLIPNASSRSYTYIFSDSDFANGITYLKVKVHAGNKDYTDRITLSYVVDGESGTSITVTGVRYNQSNNGTTHPNADDPNWSTSIPAVTLGNWLWVETSYSDDTKIYTSTYNGQDAVAYTYAIESSAGTVINTADINSGSTTTITGRVYKTEGDDAPTEILQNITYEWYKQEDGGTATQVATTKSFDFNLNGDWSNVQFYFIATISDPA